MTYTLVHLGVNVSGTLARNHWSEVRGLAAGRRPFCAETLWRSTRSGSSPTAKEEGSTIIDYTVDLYISICEDAFIRTVIVPEGAGRVPNTTLQRDAFFGERAQM